MISSFFMRSSFTASGPFDSSTELDSISSTSSISLSAMAFQIFFYVYRSFYFRISQLFLSSRALYAFSRLQISSWQYVLLEQSSVSWNSCRTLFTFLFIFTSVLSTKVSSCSDFFSAPYTAVVTFWCISLIMRASCSISNCWLSILPFLYLIWLFAILRSDYNFSNFVIPTTFSLISTILN